MFSNNALKVLEKRYLLRDENGALNETPEQLCRRVAFAVASVEKQWGATDDFVAQLTKDFFESMVDCRFMPNSPTLMNAGKLGGQLSACFVLPVPDSLEGIFDTCKNAALIHKTGGGTGFSFSRLRPANDRVASSTGVASGPVSFMTVYDAATEAIRQGGTRRGANMGMLRVDHPDIEAFISCKQDTDRLNNFNISVAITDKFMDAIEKDAQFDLIHPRTQKKVSSLNARELFAKIVKNAHSTGEPGLIFIDRINNSDPINLTFDSDGKAIPGTEDIEATNPCGEQPLGPGDACNLASINLARFVNRENGDFDFDKLKLQIQQTVRFLDDVITANCYPLKFIEEATLNNRRIGLGVMGWAEALILMGIVYGSEESEIKAEQLMKFVNDTAHDASQKLAAERGVFPNWNYSTWQKINQPMRNATVTTIAPTGTISIIAGTSSGIEPLFAVCFTRRVMGGTELIEVNPVFEMIARERGFYSDELMEKIAHSGIVSQHTEIPEDVRKLFVCSHEIPYDAHVRMQVAFQKHTDNAVSKTINFPEQATLEEVEQSYLAAWHNGLKGITVYRDNSRPLQVLNLNKSKNEASSVAQASNFEPEEDFEKKAQSAGLPGTVTSSPVEGVFISLSFVEESPDGSDIFTISNDRRADMPSIADCPDCGHGNGSVARQESCLLCLSCGYTMC